MKKPPHRAKIGHCFDRQPREQRKFDHFHDTVKKIGEIVTAVVVISSVLSIIVGIPVLHLYMDNYRFVASPSDLFSPTILMYVLAFLIWILSTILVFALAPFTMAFLTSQDVRSNFPRLFGARFTLSAPSPVSLTFKSRLARFKMQAWPTAKEYVIFYLPTILLSFSIPAMTYLEVSQKTFNILIPWIFISIFSLGLCLLYLYRLRGRAGWGDTISVFLSGNFLSGIWFVVVELVAGRALTRGVGQEIARHGYLVITCLTLMVLLLHFCLSYMRFSVPSLIGCALLIGLGLYCYPGYAEIGALERFSI